MSSPDLKLVFDNTQTKLYAVFHVADGEDAPVISKQTLLEEIKKQGHDALHSLDSGIDQVISCFTKPQKGAGKICIAEKRDAEVTLRISKNKMSAYLSVVKPEGGKKVTLDAIKQKLSEKGVRCGFLPKAIKKAIVLGEADNIEIAKGEPVVNGDDAKFTCLIKDMKIRTPKVSEDGHTDYRDLGEIQVVHTGDKLMRRDPATAGKASKNIFGETVTPKPGKDTKFAAGLEGVATSPENINILVATVTGQPIICKNGINVEKTLTVSSVDLKSGNIIFDGSIVVEGDVTSGMKVEASGDVIIKGMVENAIVEAGGDINIKGAIIGRSNNNVPTSDDLVKVEAKSSVSAKFIENATINAGDKIMVQDWVIKSSLNAVNEIVVGKKDARKGQIMGGSATSGILIKAMNIGSNAGVTTLIQAGDAHDIETEKKQVGIQVSHAMKELLELQKIFKKLKSNPTKQAKEALKKALISKKELEKELIELRMIEAGIDMDRIRAKNAKVVVGKMIYTGTLLKISKFNETVQSDLGARTFSVGKDSIVQGK